MRDLGTIISVLSSNYLGKWITGILIEGLAPQAKEKTNQGHPGFETTTNVKNIYLNVATAQCFD